MSFLLQLYNLIFNYDNIAKRWTKGGLVEGITGAIKSVFTKAEVPEDVANFFSGKKLSANLFGKGGVLYGEGFQ